MDHSGQHAKQHADLVPLHALRQQDARAPVPGTPTESHRPRARQSSGVGALRPSPARRRRARSRCRLDLTEALPVTETPAGGADHDVETSALVVHSELLDQRKPLGADPSLTTLSRLPCPCVRLGLSPGFLRKTRRAFCAMFQP